MSPRLDRLHTATLGIVAMMNGPERDAVLIREAGITLDRALFPLLVLTGRLGPIGVRDLADRVGRDHTTVSRQLVRMEAQGLIARIVDATDRRRRVCVLTTPGQTMAASIDSARERLLRRSFADWTETDIDALVRLTTQFAAAMRRAQSQDDESAAGGAHAAP
jgi:DNA-binding MarR family transcriptional regulator